MESTGVVLAGVQQHRQFPITSCSNMGIVEKMDLLHVRPVETRLVVQNANDRIYQIRTGSGIGVSPTNMAPRRALDARSRTCRGAEPVRYNDVQMRSVRW